jgi:hypothetical protein
MLTVKSLIPADRSHVDIMEIAPPERWSELAMQMQAYLKTHPLAEADDQQPYHERLGLSKVEFEEMQKLGGVRKLRRVGTTTIRVTKDGNQFFIDGGSKLEALHEIELDLNKNVLKTPYGDANNYSTIVVTDPKAVTGPWSGRQWKSERGSLVGLSAKTVKLALGRLSESGRGILYFDLGELDRKGTKSISYILLYDLKATQ